MNANTRRRLFLGVAILVAGGAIAYLSLGNLGENLVYYWSPKEVLAAGAKAQGATIRLGGQVANGSLKTDTTGIVTFVLTDGEATVPVRAATAPPAMFREGIGALVEGTMGADGTFEAGRVLVKHNNEYRAPVQGKHPEEIYKSVEGL